MTTDEIRVSNHVSMMKQQERNHLLAYSKSFMTPGFESSRTAATVLPLGVLCFKALMMLSSLSGPTSIVAMQGRSVEFTSSAKLSNAP